MFDLSTLDRHFPHQQYREGQREAIEFAATAYNSGKRLVILEAPTGSGKSAIGMTLMNMCRNSFYLTITKLLQDQLVHEFGADLVELKGRGSYPCSYWYRLGQKLVSKGALSPQKLAKILASKPNCSEGYCKIDGNEYDTRGNKCTKCFTSIKGETSSNFLQVLPPGMQHSACPYYEQYFAAVHSRQVVMNFAAFLNQTHWGSQFGTRELMVLDEAHNIEQVLMDFVTITLDDRILLKFGHKLPKFEHALEYAIWFAERNIVTLVATAAQEAKEAIREQADQVDQRRALVARHEELSRLVTKLRSFMQGVAQDGATEWVCEYDVIHTPQYSHNRVTLRPVFVHQFVQPMLLTHARHVLMMSATILDIDVLCRSLGLHREEIAAYRMRNRFPVANRPIYYTPAAKATGGIQKMARWGPKLAAAVDTIAAAYPTQRGIVHTHSFALAECLLTHCNESTRTRFTYQKNFFDKQQLLQHHERTAGSIIIAPAMHEGVDLPGDISRFQVLCKVPYPNYFENKQLARRRELDPEYYKWITALKLVQSYGRSIRSETDSADTYIIDAAFRNFYLQNKRLLPRWFREALIWVPAGEPAQPEVLADRGNHDVQ